MTADELLALKWLQGGDTDRRLGIEPGRAALIRLLENPPLSNPDICHSLARVLTPVAVGERRLTLVMSSRRGRGRPSKAEAVKGIVRAMKERDGQLTASPDTISREMLRKPVEQEN
jgi:hypothetical protein